MAATTAKKSEQNGNQHSMDDYDDEGDDVIPFSDIILNDDVILIFSIWNFVLYEFAEDIRCEILNAWTIMSAKGSSKNRNLMQD